MKVRIIEANGFEKKEATFDYEFIQAFIKNNSAEITNSPGVYGNSTTGSLLTGSLLTDSSSDYITTTTGSGTNITYTDTSSFSTLTNGGLFKIYLPTS